MMGIFLLPCMQLGAGTAVPGIVAAKCGAHVVLSDREDNPQLLQNLRSTCTINGLGEDEVDILALSWGIFSPALLQLETPDLILASDCFYNSKGAHCESDPEQPISQTEDCILYVRFRKSALRAISNNLQMQNNT